MKLRAEQCHEKETTQFRQIIFNNSEQTYRSSPQFDKNSLHKLLEKEYFQFSQNNKKIVKKL